MGVCGRLGILKPLAPVAGEEGAKLAGEEGGLCPNSGFKKLGRSPTAISTPPLGGDCGGSTIRDGGRSGLGLIGGGGPGRFGEREALLGPRPRAREPGISSLSLGLCFGTVGNSLEGAGATSRGLSGFGAGEMGRNAGGPCDSVGFVIFSNWARSEETGFWMSMC